MVKTLTQEDHPMARRSVFAVVLAGLLVGCAGIQRYAASTPVDKGRPPVVVDVYAAPSIAPGDAWTIFLKAEDPDGDMKSITAVLWQAGVGYYPPEVTMLKPGDGKQFSGYLLQQTPVDFSLNWDELELTLYVRDAQGNVAQSVKLPLRFDMAARPVVPETWREASGTRIAALMFNIESSARYNRGGNADFD
jgi:hypothetical protein